jgi:serine protease AprX
MEVAIHMTRSIRSVNPVRGLSALMASIAALLVFFAVLAGGHRPDFSPPIRAASGGSGGSTAALDPRLARLASTAPHRLVEAIAQFKPGVTQSAARADVARVGGRVFGELHIIPALAVRLTAAQTRMLATSPDVHAVSLNSQVESSTWAVGGTTSNLQTTYNQTLNAPSLWFSGDTGSGVGVAVIDTGVDGNLPDFQSASGTSRVIATAVTNPSALTATDSYGHGTDVAAIIAGNGDRRATTDTLYGQYIGVAPNANLISIKASDETGTATVLNVIYGLQFAVDHQSQYNIRVVNMSLDAATAQSYKTDPLDAAAESAWMHGIVVVVAAGNRGTTPDAVQYAPANDPYVITVGATDENGSTYPGDDTLAAWSSRGTTQDGFQKPDVTAPGAHIVSLLAPNSAFASLCPACVVGGQYIKVSGTSLAAPMIAGVVADVLQVRPNLTPNQVKALLTQPAAFSNSSLSEVDASRLTWLSTPYPGANQGLTPNQLIMDSAGDINYAASSWSASSWSTATGAQSASFAASSWSCACAGAATSGVGTSASSWSASSWSQSSWSTLEPLEPEPGSVRATDTPAAKAIARAAEFASNLARQRAKGEAR